jgi:hypothetical protein
MLYMIFASNHKNLWPGISKSVDDRGTELLFPKDPRETFVQNITDLFWDPYGLLFSGFLGFFFGSNEAGDAADHRSHSSAKVKNVWSCTSTLFAF